MSTLRLRHRLTTHRLVATVLMICALHLSAAVAAAPPAIQPSVDGQASLGVAESQDLYPDNCLSDDLPATPRGQSIAFPIWLYPPNTPTIAIESTAMLWREPCSNSKSVLLLRVVFPQVGYEELSLPSFGCSNPTCEASLHFFGFSRTPDDDRSLVSTLRGTETLALQVRQPSALADATSSLFAVNQPIDAQFTVSYLELVEGGTFPRFVRRITAQTAVLPIPGYDPAQYAETQLPDLLTGHVTGAYYDPERPGEGILIELARFG